MEYGKHNFLKIYLFDQIRTVNYYHPQKLSYKHKIKKNLKSERETYFLTVTQI